VHYVPKQSMGRIVLLGVVLALVATPVVAGPTPAGGYHWARKDSQFTLQVGDDLDGGWEGYLRKTVSDWNQSGAVTFRVVSGGTGAQDCRPQTGRVEVCNWRYGTQEGWLGLTRLYFDDSGDHIDAATVQMNDSFFEQNNGQYNNDASRQHTMCHELGHTPGLEHVNTSSCMNDSQDAVQHQLVPINKDFNELDQIYQHKDSYTTVGGKQKKDKDDSKKKHKKHKRHQDDRAIKDDFFLPTSLPAVPSGLVGTQSEVVQTLEDGRKVVSFITWAAP
jgi:hypothetical protein